MVIMHTFPLVTAPDDLFVASMMILITRCDLDDSAFISTIQRKSSSVTMRNLAQQHREISSKETDLRSCMNYVCFEH